VTRAPVLAVGLFVLTLACVREARDGHAIVRIGEIGPEGVEGRVRAVGNAPFVETLIEPEEGEAWRVSGPFRSELRRLAGARVRVTGLPVRTSADSALEASSYEILSVDGDRPLVGRLARDQDGYFLELPAKGMRRVAAVSEPLAQQLGALIWAVLDTNDGIARYGVLRPPS